MTTMPDQPDRAHPVENGPAGPAPEPAEPAYRELMTALLVERFGAALRSEPRRRAPAGRGRT